ncbi:MAG: hypothetical protein JST84_21235 [Acidobacteria bacterium]|nr:hypothetical protein [Acidobacteriota bacterium]
MLQTVEAEIDVNGNIRLLEPLPVTKPRRVLVTLLAEGGSAENGVVNTAPIEMPPAATTPETRRQEQMAWMKANAELHGGQYVALVGAQLISTGKTFREANEVARAAGCREAVVTYLPKPDEVIEMGGWL